MMSPLSPTHHNKKRHTKPCIYFQQNQCPFTPEDCDFAHVYDEQAMSGPDALRSKYRTKPCRYYLAGSCTQEIWCRFKHPIGDFPRTDLDEDEDFSMVPDVRDVQPNMKRPRELHPKYKTRPCRDWLLGTCKRGTTCSYLHEQSASPTAEPMAQQYTQPAYSQWVVYHPQLQGPPSYGAFSDDDSVRTASDVSLSSPSHSSFNDHGPPTPPDQTFYLHTKAEGMPYVQAESMPYMLGPGVPFYGGQPQLSLVPVSSPQVYGYPGLWSPAAPQYGVVPIPAPRARSQPPGGRRRSASNRAKPCKAYMTLQGCPRGDKCSYEHIPLPLVMSHPDPSWAVPRTLPPVPAHIDLPDKPKNPLDDMRSKEYYPITWRVVGGGVKLARADQHELAPLEPPLFNVEPVPSPTTLTKPGHARGSSLTQKTMSISIPASARLMPAELERDSPVDILKARSTPSSPHRSYASLPIYSAAHY